MRTPHVLLALALGASCAFASACPEKLPAGMSAVTVGENVAVDGMALSMLQVASRESVAALFKRIEHEWKEAGYDVKRSNAAGWNVLSALSDTCLTTLQLVDRAGAFGYLAVNKTGRPGAARAAALPMPPGATVLSTVSSSDDGRAGTTMALTSRQPLEALNTFYMRRLREENWGAVRSDATMDRNRSMLGAIVSGQRGRERIEVLLWRDGDTQIVINLAGAL